MYHILEKCTSHLLRSLWSVTLIISVVYALLSGCIFIPPLDNENKIEYSMLDALIGDSYADVTLDLGSLDAIFASRDFEQIYLVYYRILDKAGAIGLINIAPGSSKIHSCYLLVLDNTRRLSHYHARDIGGRFDTCESDFWDAKILPIDSRLISQEVAEEKLAVIGATQPPKGENSVHQIKSQSPTRPLQVVIFPPKKTIQGARFPYSCCWEDEQIDLLSAVIQKNNKLSIYDSPNSPSHKISEIYEEPDQYWNYPGIRKPYFHAVVGVVKKGNADVAVLYDYRNYGDGIDIQIYVVDANLRKIYSKKGRRQSIQDIVDSFENLLRRVTSSQFDAENGEENGT